ncbi:HU family DNA-binding protein [Lactobacillus sp. ESL0230]|uniref:HU family DNA-binding protein n=1 Tax=Lactobacillus sp. ESL0230 TaxID=2069353 RepID=UPI000EFD1951|nr:HU family DNA-binding protein [Lactobacillus sp. ESL0230]RMC46708.1 hypothetical protein F5ESL0230_05505 [Lactobacillus sp. ESL0230]
METIKAFLANIEDLEIFKVCQHAECKVHNLQIGEKIIIPVTKIPAFKAGKILEDTTKYS